MVRYEEATDIGLVRELNEDSLLCRPPGDFVVADGMGGHAAGEIASRIFTDIADKYLSEYKEISTENDMQELFQAGNYGILTSIENILNALAWVQQLLCCMLLAARLCGPM
ncbi:MAG: protein phosphatase 2C domain-containing protein [Selenomonadaceae bacterium]|nr:protein phosphatase 2C domain-containing protein [Selenomonadaceae bacterium]